MKVALAQINTTVGDLRGNRDKILAFYRAARGQGAELVLFPELAVTGYPPRDLLEQGNFVAENLKVLSELARASRETGLLVGYADLNRAARGKPFFNAAALLHRGRVLARRQKTLLPSYDVFDETRHFEPASENRPVLFKGARLGVTLCEDAWNDEAFWPRPLYGIDPVARLARAGAGILLNISASPYHQGKGALRLKMLASHARKLSRPFLFCSLVGGNDELIFDGSSLGLDARGRLLAQAASFEEGLILVDTEKAGSLRPAGLAPMEELRRALVLGLKDYARKCGFTRAVLGLSGGIDSALTCALACEALGPENVVGVSLPSMYSSEGSVRDAKALAAHLGVRLLHLPIGPAHRLLLDELAGALGEEVKSLTEQNLQARLRGLLLMALSNQWGALLLSTGNKSELSVGYCTLYGDMSGGLALIGDVPKTTVYALARHLNARREIIPRASLEKPPSAELKPNQKDQDDLPPYETLDAILKSYIEEGESPARIAKRHPRALVEQVLARVDRNEYKRRQAPPALRITPKAFGSGRRMPIARGFSRLDAGPGAA